MLDSVKTYKITIELPAYNIDITKSFGFLSTEYEVFFKEIILGFTDFPSLKTLRAAIPDIQETKVLKFPNRSCTLIPRSSPPFKNPEMPGVLVPPVLVFFPGIRLVPS